jgi:hypothetical protein
MNQVRSAPVNGFGDISPAGAVAAGGIVGSAVGAAIEGLFVYGVTRLAADVEPSKARKSALWAAGIVFGLSTIMTLAVAGGVSSVDTTTSTST